MAIGGVYTARLDEDFHEAFKAVTFSFGVADARRPLLLNELFGCLISQQQVGMKEEHDSHEE